MAKTASLHQPNITKFSDTLAKFSYSRLIGSLVRKAERGVSWNITHRGWFCSSVICHSLQAVIILFNWNLWHKTEKLEEFQQLKRNCRAWVTNRRRPKTSPQKLFNKWAVVLTITNYDCKLVDACYIQDREFLCCSIAKTRVWWWMATQMKLIIYRLQRDSFKEVTIPLLEGRR